MWDRPEVPKSLPFSGKLHRGTGCLQDCTNPKAKEADAAPVANPALRDPSPGISTSASHSQGWAILSLPLP